MLLAASFYVGTGDSPKAEAVLKRARHRRRNIDAYNLLGTICVKDGRLDEARREFEDAAKRQSKPAMATTMVGIIAMLQNKQEDARKQFEEALALDPNSAVAANNLAWLYAQSGGNLDVALQLAQTAKAKMPNRHEVDDTLGWIYYRKGLSTLAIASFKQSVATAPENPTYIAHLGLAYAQAGDLANARHSLEKALKIKPDFEGADEARRILKTTTTG